MCKLPLSINECNVFTELIPLLCVNCQCRISLIFLSTSLHKFEFPGNNIIAVTQFFMTSSSLNDQFLGMLGSPILEYEDVI